MAFTSFDLGTYNRIEMAIELANSFLKSNFHTFDAVELAMEQQSPGVHRGAQTFLLSFNLLLPSVATDDIL